MSLPKPPRPPEPGAKATGPEILCYSALLFAPLAFGCVETWSRSILELLLFALFIWCRWRALPWGGTIAERMLLPAVLAVLLLALIQSLNPADPAAPRQLLPFTASAHGTSRAFLLWCAYACLLSCLPQLASTPEGHRRLLGVLILAGVLVAVIGLLQRESGQRLIYGLREVSIYQYYAPFGPFYNRNHAASLMLLSLFAGLGVFFSRWSSWRGSRGVGARSDLAAQQILLAVLLLLIAAGILLSGSRAALGSLAASLAAGLALSALRASRAARLALIGFLLASVCGYAVVLQRNPRYLAPLIGPQSKLEDNPWTSRLSLYKSGWSMLQDAPWVGFGLGGFSAAFPLYQGSSIGAVRVEHVHSDWLELGLETGVLGLGACAAGLLLLMVRALSSADGERGAKNGVEALWLACAVSGFVLHGLVEFNFSTPASAVYFLAVLSALGARAAPAGPWRVGLGAQRLVSLLGLVLAAMALRPLASSYHLTLASQADIPVKPVRLAEAYHWDPRPETLRKLSAARFELAQLSRPLSVSRVREAFLDAQRAFLAEPHHKDIRFVYGSLLWRLGRVEDARRFL